MPVVLSPVHLCILTSCLNAGMAASLVLPLLKQPGPSGYGKCSLKARGTPSWSAVQVDPRRPREERAQDGHRVGGLGVGVSTVRGSAGWEGGSAERVGPRRDEPSSSTSSPSKA